MSKEIERAKDIRRQLRAVISDRVALEKKEVKLWEEFMEALEVIDAAGLSRIHVTD